MRDISERFKALSDPNRLRILMLLKSKPLCVCEISSILQLANSTTSKHLSILRRSGFITSEKSGRWVNYRLVQAFENLEAAMLIPQVVAWLNDDDTIRSDLALLDQVDRNAICSTN